MKRRAQRDRTPSHRGHGRVADLEAVAPGPALDALARLARRISIAAVLVLLVVTGCGVRTAPRAPEDTAAAAPDAIQARSTPQGATITWSRPTKTVDRSRLYDLATFVVERSVDDGAFVPIATIDVTDQDRIRPRQSFRYVDDTVPPGTVRYRVRAVTADGEPGIATEPARPTSDAEATAGPGAATAEETPTK